MRMYPHKQLTWICGVGGADRPGHVLTVGRLVGAALEAEVALRLEALHVVDYERVVVAAVRDGVILPDDTVQLTNESEQRGHCYFVIDLTSFPV